MTQPADYFTIPEFYDYVGITSYVDPEPSSGAELIESSKYTYARVEMFQAEAIARLERWAGSAWPNVIEDLEDEDLEVGKTNVYRSFTEYIGGVRSGLLLSRVPVRAPLTSVAVGTTSIGSGAYTLTAETGEIAFVSEVDAGRSELAVTYFYGYGETPIEVKLPVMHAVKARIDSLPGGSELPDNLASYTTETATFVFADPSGAVVPWPWDHEASNEIRSYWNPARPRRIAVV